MLIRRLLLEDRLFLSDEMIVLRIEIAALKEQRRKTATLKEERHQKSIKYQVLSIKTEFIPR